MRFLDALAEQRIAEARERGDFDALPGSGRPLQLEDDTLVPEELRVAWRLLKNAGFVPPEVESLRALRDLETCVAGAADDEARARAVRKLRALETALAARAGPGRRLAPDPRYRARILARFG